MGVDVMRSPCNFEPKYRDTVLTREEWIRGPGTSSTVMRLVWYTDGSRTLGGEPRPETMGTPWEKAQYHSRKICYSLSG